MKGKRWIIAALLAAVLVAGSIGGVVLAAEDGDNGEVEAETEAECETIFERVANILAEDGVDVTAEQLKDAFQEVRIQMQTEALQRRLQALVEKGRIEQGDADAFLEWWSERPDVPFGFGLRGLGRFGGERKVWRFGAPCVPAE